MQRNTEKIKSIKFTNWCIDVDDLLFWYKLSWINERDDFNTCYNSINYNRLDCALIYGSVSIINWSTY